MSKKKGKDSEKKEKNNDDAEISIDFKKVGSFLKRNYLIFLVLIPIFLAVFFRAYPAYLPIADSWAESNVANYYKSIISDEVNKQYPQLPQSNKDIIIKREVEKVLDQQEDQIKQQKAQLSNEIRKGFQDENGNTYLLAIDPYYYYRYARNVVETGNYYDELKNGTPWDNHMKAPVGAEAHGHFHVGLGVFFYNIGKFFNKNLDIMSVMFFLPILISALSIIPAFFLAKKVGGNFGGLVGASLIAVHGALLTRTVGGFSDTDAYNAFFPLIIMWLFVEAFEAKETKNKIILTSLTALVTGIFAYAWIAWWYVFDFILGTIGVFLIYLLVKNWKKIIQNLKEKKESLELKEIKSNLLLAIIYVVVSGIFVTLFTSFKSFSQFLTGPLKVITLKAASHATLWPNVYTTVAELNSASLSSIIGNMGGMFLFLIALGGIAATLLRKVNGKTDVKYFIFLLIWFFGTIYASTKGIRFTLLLVPAFGIAVGACIGIIYKYLTKWISKGFDVSEKILKPTLIIAIILIFFIMPILPGNRSLLSNADLIARNEVPGMNDAWYNTLTKIKDNSQEDAIINSWWDFGHWFKAIGDRAVTFDGGSQNTPMAHWIGKVLLTDDEELAIGILRMLDCGSNTGTEEIDKQFNDTKKAVDVMYKIIKQDKNTAKSTLKSEGFSDESADNILEKTHCDPPEDFFIASNDMVGKSGVWAHFGSWDFERAKIWINVKNMNYNEGGAYLTEEFGYDEGKATQVYYEVQSLFNEQQANEWIAPWPSYGSSYGNCIEDGEMLICQRSGIIFNKTSEDAVLSLQQGLLVPQRVAMIENGNVRMLDYTAENMAPLVNTIFVNNGTYSSISAQPGLEASMFTRMFFDQGRGLKHFKLFNTEREPSGGMIYTFKVEW